MHNQEAVAATLERMRPAVMKYVLAKFLVTVEDAEDIIQNTAYRIFKRQSIYTAGCSIEQAVSRAVHDCGVDFVRAKEGRGKVKMSPTVPLNEEITAEPVEEPKPDDPYLSFIEYEIFDQLSSGKSPAQIATLRGNKISTIHFHITSAYAKLGAKSLLEALTILGCVTPLSEVLKAKCSQL